MSSDLDSLGDFDVVVFEPVLERLYAAGDVASGFSLFLHGRYDVHEEVGGLLWGHLGYLLRSLSVFCLDHADSS